MVYRTLVTGSLMLLSLAAAAGDLDVQVKCGLPAAANGPLRVDLVLSNSDCLSPALINELMVGVAGNAGGSLTLIGPFKKGFASPIVVPKANCAGRIRPGRAIRRIVVTNNTPAEFAGTMGLVFVEGLDANGAGKYGNQCFVEITP